MPILLPLTLLGVGYLAYLLFAGATLAPPIALAAAIGVGASRLGCPPLLACILAMLAFVTVVAASRIAALTLVKPQARIALASLFAVPAALAGYSVGAGLGVFAGIVAAITCAAIAAHRMVRPAI